MKQSRQRRHRRNRTGCYRCTCLLTRLPGLGLEKHPPMVGPGLRGTQGEGGGVRLSGWDASPNCVCGNLQVLAGHRTPQLLHMTCRRKDGVNNALTAGATTQELLQEITSFSTESSSLHCFQFTTLAFHLVCLSDWENIWPQSAPYVLMVF